MYRETAEVVRGLQEQLRKQRVFSGPDYEEGPQSAIKEEEFFDAVETALDKQEKELDESTSDGIHNSSVSAKSQLSVLSPAQADDIWEDIEQVKFSQKNSTGIFSWISLDYFLMDFVGGGEFLQITGEQFKYALLGVGEGGWQLFNEDGEMKMYRREEEKDGKLSINQSINGQFNHCTNLSYNHSINQSINQPIGNCVFSQTINQSMEDQPFNHKLYQSINQMDRLMIFMWRWVELTFASFYDFCLDRFGRGSAESPALRARIYSPWNVSLFLQSWRANGMGV